MRQTMFVNVGILSELLFNKNKNYAHNGKGIE